MTDWQLLQNYVQTRSQDAFAELVRRHSPWVRAAARRQVHDEHLADDVAQAAFLALSQQAARLRENGALSTWLFQVTRYASSAALRARSRRRHHELQAAAMTPNAHQAAATSGEWEQLAPMLDNLVARLRRDDQHAVLLRFYEQKSYPDMAGVLGISEEAARKRTDRAVDKLRHMIARHDVSLSVSTLSATLLAQAADAAPLTNIPAASPQVAAISQGALQMMKIARLKIPAALTVIVLLVTAGAITFSRGASATSPAPARASAPANPATTTPATTTPLVDPNSPKGVIMAAFRAAAAGDANGLISRFERVTPQQGALLKQITDLMSAADDLNKAINEKFDAEVESDLSRMIGSGVLDADIAFATEAIEGNRAVVDIGAGPGKIALSKTGDTWKISADVLGTLNPRAIATFATGAPAIRKLAADVRAGKYKSMDELKQAMAGFMR